ncbi:hypothetical protein GCM10023340_16950 [Nocardioides marinquilinus]|uniref:Peptidyl-prolyl cis-trans isomerase n=1 Tax=Nocardioides marinquilinus TaxID=1210400 RepID=A0ABP9PIF7_9ACTN
MTRPLPQRLAAATAAGLLALTLAACGNESDGDENANDDTGSQSSESSESSDAAPSSDPASSDAASSDAPAESPSEEGSEAGGELPAWAPEVVTDAEGDVTALDFTDTPEPTGELEVATITEGDGPPVEAGQTLTVDYFGAVYQGDAQFDDSYSRGEPATFPIGVGQLIQGWDEGIPGTPVGSRIIMMIPPDLGYGAAGSPPVIPADSTLYFVIDVLDAS